MSDQMIPAVAAGWYLDPEMPGTQRYWDGTAWTEHRAPTVALSAPIVMKKTNGPAVAGLVIGIVGLLVTLFPGGAIFGGLPDALAIVLGILGLQRNRGRFRGMAIVAIVLGGAGMLWVFRQIYGVG